MNSEMPKAEESLCWKCQYGICVQEKASEKIVHPVMPNILDLQGTDDPFASHVDDEHEDQGQQPGIVEHILEQEHVKAMCFWQPEDFASNVPILVAFVTKCSRFKHTKDLR